MFRLHDHLVRAATELIEVCACEAGCPSCVGPILEVGSTGKADALAVLRGGLPVPAHVPVSSVPA
jgi:DEAD/DEAH box helicase domain-containing protein